MSRAKPAPTPANPASAPTLRLTITANHPNAHPSHPPLCGITYMQDIADSMVERLTALGYTGIQVVREEIGTKQP